MPLEIDHIVPFSEGGVDGEANLRTVCWACNRGRSGLRIMMRRTLAYPVARKGKGRKGPQIPGEIYEYLASHGKATASQIALGIHRPRTKLVFLLNHDSRFIKLPKEGRDVPYAIAVPLEPPRI